MEEIVSKLENIANKLTGDKSYVYILEEYECYDGISKIIGCYDTPHKAYDAACNIIDWVSFSSEDLNYLRENHSIESYDIGNMSVKVYKFNVQ